MTLCRLVLVVVVTVVWEHTVSPPAANIAPAACISSSSSLEDMLVLNHFAQNESSAVPAAYNPINLLAGITHLNTHHHIFHVVKWNMYHILVL